MIFHVHFDRFLWGEPHNLQKNNGKVEAAFQDRKVIFHAYPVTGIRLGYNISRRKKKSQSVWEHPGSTIEILFKKFYSRTARLSLKRLFLKHFF
jgi:hypothetical protein